MNVFVRLVLADLHKKFEPLYSDIGGPAVDPELMIRMPITGYPYRIRSERMGAEEACGRRLSSAQGAQ
jgi:transposase